MAKTYKNTLTFRLGNLFAKTMLRAGVKMGNMALLTVRGRKSGQPRTTPVAVLEQDGYYRLIAPYGSVNWVRNLRAAGEATLTRGRRSEHVSARELDAREAAPLLKDSLAKAPAFLRSYFDVTPTSSLEDFEREAPRHPVFLLQRFQQQSDGLTNPQPGKAVLS